MPLALDYRPKTIDDLAGQPHVQKILKGVLSRYAEFDDLPRMFLFYGSHGSGKTTSARLLARYLNCDKGPLVACGKCDHCKAVDRDASDGLLEIDAASNRGIDDVRDLKAKLNFKCRWPKRIVVLDECHALTKDGAAALLKVFEEERGGRKTSDVFVLCTTEAHQVLDTIKSRAIPIQINTLNEEDLMAHISKIAAKEKIKITKEAVRMIVTLSRGHCRDALQLLETCWLYSGGKTVKTKAILDSSGYYDQAKSRAVIVAFLTKSNQELYDVCKGILEDPVRVIRTILIILRAEINRQCHGTKKDKEKAYFPKAGVGTLIELNSLFHAAHYHFERNGFSIFVLTYFLEVWAQDKPMSMLERIK